MAHAAERQNATQKRCKLRFARMPGRARHGRRGWAREANTKPMPRAQAHGGRNIGWRRGRRASDTGVVRQQLMRVWETGVHEQSAGPQTRKYSPRPGVCPMESSQPPGEGSPRPRPGQTSLRCHSPGGVLVGEATRVPRAAGRKDTIRRIRRHPLEPSRLRRRYATGDAIGPGGQRMKRVLIVAAMGILASTGWAASANAQANMDPNLYPRRQAAQQGWEWHAAPGPNKRGGMCITHTDPLRGYGFQSPCPAPKGSTRHAIRR
jgi:hypothetical protein